MKLINYKILPKFIFRLSGLYNSALVQPLMAVGTTNLFARAIKCEPEKPCDVTHEINIGNFINITYEFLEIIVALLKKYIINSNNNKRYIRNTINVLYQSFRYERSFADRFLFLFEGIMKVSGEISKTGNISNTAFAFIVIGTISFSVLSSNAFREFTNQKLRKKYIANSIKDAFQVNSRKYFSISYYVYDSFLSGLNVAALGRVLILILTDLSDKIFNSHITQDLTGQYLRWSFMLLCYFLGSAFALYQNYAGTTSKLNKFNQMAEYVKTPLISFILSYILISFFLINYPTYTAISLAISAMRSGVIATIDPEFRLPYSFQFFRADRSIYDNNPERNPLLNQPSKNQQGNSETNEFKSPLHDA